MGRDSPGQVIGPSYDYQAEINQTAQASQTTPPPLPPRNSQQKEGSTTFTEKKTDPGAVVSGEDKEDGEAPGKETRNASQQEIGSTTLTGKPNPGAVVGGDDDPDGCLGIRGGGWGKHQGRRWSVDRRREGT